MRKYDLIKNISSKNVVPRIKNMQVYAPRTCTGCAEFQKLTDEFENKVLNTALGNPEEIPALVDEYSANVKALFASSSPTP